LKLRTITHISVISLILHHICQEIKENKEQIYRNSVLIFSFLDASNFEPFRYRN
jgi:hypothetical protein